MQSNYLCIILHVQCKKLLILTPFTWFLILDKIQVGDQVWWRHRPSPIKYTSSCREDQRLSTEGKIVSKYCSESNTQEGSIKPATLYHGGGKTLCVRLRVKLTVSTRSSKLDSRFSKPFDQLHNAKEHCVISLYTDIRSFLFFSPTPTPLRFFITSARRTLKRKYSLWIQQAIAWRDKTNAGDSNKSSFKPRKLCEAKICNKIETVMFICMCP